MLISRSFRALPSVRSSISASRPTQILLRPASSSTTVSQPPQQNDQPEAKAQQMLSRFGPKTAFKLLTAAGVGTYLISKEILMTEEHFCVALSFSVFTYFLTKNAIGPIKEAIADTKKSRSQEFHTAKASAETAMSNKIESITGSGITNLAAVTDQIFDFAVEVAKLEGEAHVHSQRIAYNTRAKQILDEWVRYESAIRDKEQRRIVAEVMAKVREGVADPKFQEQYLNYCISELDVIAKSN